MSGSVNETGAIVEGSPSDMKHVGADQTGHRYEGLLECRESGSYGFSVRVIPYHPDVVVPFEHPWIVWGE